MFETETIQASLIEKKTDFERSVLLRQMAYDSKIRKTDSPSEKDEILYRDEGEGFSLVLPEGEPGGEYAVLPSFSKNRFLVLRNVYHERELFVYGFFLIFGSCYEGLGCRGADRCQPVARSWRPIGHDALETYLFSASSHEVSLQKKHLALLPNGMLLWAWPHRDHRNLTFMFVDLKAPNRNIERIYSRYKGNIVGQKETFVLFEETKENGQIKKFAVDASLDFLGSLASFRVHTIGSLDQIPPHKENASSKSEEKTFASNTEPSKPLLSLR